MEKYRERIRVMECLREECVKPGLALTLPPVVVAAVEDIKTPKVGFLLRSSLINLSVGLKEEGPLLEPPFSLPSPAVVDGTGSPVSTA